MSSSTPTTAISRFFAIGAALLVLASVLSCGGNLFLDGFWERVYPAVICVAGAFLLYQLISIMAVGRSGIAANHLWMMVGSFGFFNATFNFLVMVFPKSLWNNPEVVNQKLKDSVVLNDYPAMYLALSVLLIVIAAIGYMIEDTNPDLEPAR